MATPKTPKGGSKSTNAFSSSPWLKVTRETGQSWELRKELLDRVQKHFNAHVVSFFTSFRLNTQIDDGDAEMLESVLSADHDGGKLVLILNSPGGFALAAERIVNVCRAYSKDNFEVIVPHMAKSAATMICFGANKIHMSKTAELGPVDPQVRFKDDVGNVTWISADEYIRSYEQLFDAAAKAKAKNMEPYLQQLIRYDSRYIEKLSSARRLSKDISVRLLKTGMMAKQSKASIEKKIDVFLSQSKTSAHGRMINFAGAEECGLNVSPIDLYSDVWNDLWELFVRCDWAVSTTCAKLIESPTTHVHGAVTQGEEE